MTRSMARTLSCLSSSSSSVFLTRKKFDEKHPEPPFSKRVSVTLSRARSTVIHFEDRSFTAICFVLGGRAVSTRPTAAEGDRHAGRKSSAGKPINYVAVAGSPGPPGLFRSSEAVDRLTNGGKKNQCEPQRTLINRPCNVRNKPGGRGPAEEPWRPTKRLVGKQHTTNTFVDPSWTGAAKRWNGVWNHLWNQCWNGVWNGLGTNVLGSAG
jgi:hypothetical protein